MTGWNESGFSPSWFEYVNVATITAVLNDEAPLSWIDHIPYMYRKGVQVGRKNAGVDKNIFMIPAATCNYVLTRSSMLWEMYKW